MEHTNKNEMSGEDEDMASGHPLVCTPIDAGDAVSARSRQLFSYVTASESFAAPKASMLADLIEHQILAHPPGAVFGHEAELARNLDIGRRLMRQASRLLQERGLLTARRGGGGVGGLISRAPDHQTVVLRLAATLHGTDVAPGIDDARSFLEKELAGDSSPVPRLLFDVIACLEGKPSRLPDMNGDQAAQRLAIALADQYALGARDSAPCFIGSLDSIAEQAGTSLSVAVEAVRLLEERQLVVLSRGRGGGVHSSPGGAAQAARMCNAYLAGAGVSAEQCDTVLRAINVEMINLACRRSAGKNHDDMHAALAAMASAPGSSDLGVGWFLLQRSIAELADSPVLHLFARCLSSSILLRRVRSPELPEAEARELLQASVVITQNLSAGRTAGNRQAHWRCQQALEAYW